MDYEAKEKKKENCTFLPYTTEYKKWENYKTWPDVVHAQKG